MALNLGQKIAAQSTAEPGTASAAQTQETDCCKYTLTSNSAAFFVELLPVPHERHGFALAQLLHYTCEPNPAALGVPEAPPERLTLDFSTADIVILGWRLTRIVDAVREHKLLWVRALDPRYANADAHKPFVAEIVIQPLDRPKAEPPGDFDDRPVISSLNPPGSGPGNTAPLPSEHSRSSGPHSARR
jgi:hypothetical protein